MKANDTNFESGNEPYSIIHSTDTCYYSRGNSKKQAVIKFSEKTDDCLLQRQQSRISGQCQAYAAGTRLVRERIPKPGNFEQIAKQWHQRHGTSAEIAAHLGISRSLLYKWLREFGTFTQKEEL